MRNLIPAVAAAMLALSPAIFPEAAFAAPPRIKGERCNVGSASPGTWVGYFDGYREVTSVFTLRDIRKNVTAWRCFRSKADCTAWKYWMQTDFDAGPKVTWCRKK